MRNMWGEVVSVPPPSAELTQEMQRWQQYRRLLVPALPNHPRNYSHVFLTEKDGPLLPRFQPTHVYPGNAFNPRLSLL